jgi:hypothetical protein
LIVLAFVAFVLSFFVNNKGVEIASMVFTGLVFSFTSIMRIFRLERYAHSSSKIYNKLQKISEKISVDIIDANNGKYTNHELKEKILKYSKKISTLEKKNFKNGMAIAEGNYSSSSSSSSS